jgi:hypothetical protein
MGNAPRAKACKIAPLALTAMGGPQEWRMDQVIPARLVLFRVVALPCILDDAHDFVQGDVVPAVGIGTRFGWRGCILRGVYVGIKG